MKIDLDLLRSELGKITDPDLGYTLEKLDCINEITQNENEINIRISLIPPYNWIDEDVKKQCNEIVEKLYPGTEAEVLIEEVALPTSPRKFLKDVKHIVAVASGKGGVGKSAVASNLAAALAMNGVKVGLIDGDIYGPSQPTIWGMKDVKLPAEPAPDGGTIVYPAEKFGVKLASMGFLMQEGDAAVVRGPILAGYLQMLIQQIEWGELDFLVFDLPPGTGDIQLTLTQQTPLTGAVVVTTPQEISVVDVRRSVKMFEKVNVPVLGIVENMSYFVPDDAPEKRYYIFGEGGGKRIANESKVRFLGDIPLLEHFRRTNDNGLPFVLNHEAGPYAENVHSIVLNIIQEIRRLNYEKSKESSLEISI